ncbi:hypothetical protein [Brevundimonas sp.]
MKVFTWSDGFHAFTVATTSRPKALEAWGSRQDLFASGLASPLTEGPDYEAALASPGEVIERGLAVDIGKILRSRRPVRPLDAAREAKARARREALETQLAQLDTAHAEAVAEREEVLARIDAERGRAEASYETRRKAIVADLKKARQQG